jgi:hypothetical protein
LGDDVLNLDKDGNFIEHPFGGKRNNKFTFHSPETDYFRPTLPTELSVQGYMFGESANTTDEVLGHSKWVILTSRAKDLSSILATTETAAEIAIQAAMALSNTNLIVGFSNTVIPGGLIASAIITAIGVAEGIVSKVGRYRLEWQNTFRNLGTPTNFAYYSYATGKYNFLKQTDLEFQNLRSLSVRAYINESEGIVNDEITGETYLVNNLHRERAVFISTPRAIDYYDEYREWDNNTLNNQTSSLTFASQNNMCTQGESAKYYRNIASPYVALKNYLPRQHGSINAINWLTTGYVGDLSSPKESCFGIFGGDTFIARHTLKRKIPFFLQDMVGEADMRPFNYKFYSNIGARARYFVDYEILSDFRERNILFPDIQYDFNLDCTTRAGLYYRTPSKFYLYSYGFPSFLAETRINTYNRTAKPGIEGNFFPNAPIRQYTQEREVSIQRNESFNYSTIYSKGVTKTASRMLAFNFSQADNDCRNDKPNGIHWSLPDNSENNYSDPWLVFRPLNYYEFPTTYGALKDLRTIENEQILVRCENTTALYNAVDSTIDDGKAPEARNLLTSFARRPAVYSETDLGYGGTDSTNSVSCEYGHFHVDVKRGQVIQIAPGGKGMEDIASTVDGKPSGLANWLRFHLPFFILRDFPNLDVDNPWNGLGITMGWDARLKRVFITKKDYRTKVDCITYENNNFYLGCGDEDCENSNLIVNGTFNTNIEGWTTGLDNWIWFDGAMRYIGADEAIPVYQDVLTVGKQYKVTFDLQVTDLADSDSVWLKVFLGETEVNINLVEGQILQEFTAICTETTRFAFQAFYEGGTSIIEVDNVCVIEAKQLISLDDSRYFEDKSWTLGFDVVKRRWIGWYSYTPNYYVSHNDYFQTGFNNESDFGLWSHLLTNKSYQVFQGRKYPFYLEYQAPREYNNKTLKTIEYECEARRYHNEFDYAVHRDRTFNKAAIFSTTQDSGNLELDYNTGQISLISKYPITAPDNKSQKILVTNSQDKYTINYFYNRVLKNYYNSTIRKWDTLQIKRVETSNVVKFSGKNTLEYLSGAGLNVQLIQDKDTHFRYLVNILVSKNG